MPCEKRKPLSDGTLRVISPVLRQICTDPAPHAVSLGEDSCYTQTSGVKGLVSGHGQEYVALLAVYSHRHAVGLSQNHTSYLAKQWCSHQRIYKLYTISKNLIKFSP